LVTCSHIRRNHCRGNRIPTRVTNQESALSHGINRLAIRLEYASKRRRFVKKANFKGVEIELGPLDLYQHPVAGVAYEPCKTVGLSQPEDKRPESDPLNNSVDS
jgi:hypothetical protein